MLKWEFSTQFYCLGNYELDCEAVFPTSHHDYHFFVDNSEPSIQEGWYFIVNSRPTQSNVTVIYFYIALLAYLTHWSE